MHMHISRDVQFLPLCVWADVVRMEPYHYKYGHNELLLLGQAECGFRNGLGIKYPEGSHERSTIWHVARQPLLGLLSWYPAT